ncbi:hypothetical protein A0H81_12632 [Grifola frondosa]|uniref:Uncharacterized protein n=1 Tax=Grifola frondosa TaxID=5627 RepID=A0A1C7LWZ4_GRIFR|nr:hypothetical protein A0H81_12632 [Grifola frondosa]
MASLRPDALRTMSTHLCDEREIMVTVSDTRRTWHVRLEIVRASSKPTAFLSAQLLTTNHHHPFVCIYLLTWLVNLVLVLPLALPPGLLLLPLPRRAAARTLQQRPTQAVLLPLLSMRPQFPSGSRADTV